MTAHLPLFDGMPVPAAMPLGLAPRPRPASSWPFEPLQMLGYDVIMADPPWAFELRSDKGEAKSPQAHYDCMETREIAALPVGDLARGDCWLWLWATGPMLRDAELVMDRWGFARVTMGTWVKRGRSGKLAMGTGYHYRCAAEFWIVGRMGNPPTFSRSIRNVIEAPRRQNSRKPDEAYAVAEQHYGINARRADLFSRQSRPGWEAWGNETTKFDAGGGRWQ